MNKIEHKNRSYGQYFFWHYVIRFFFIGILTTAMLIPSYCIMMNSMRKNEIYGLDSNMEERFQKLNSTLNMVAGQARLASNEISIIQIGMARELSNERGKDQYELSQARNWFSSSISQDELVVNAYMLSENNHAFVSRTLVTTQAEEIYGTFYEVEGYNSEDWRAAILNAEEGFAFLPSKRTNATFAPSLLNQKEPMIHMIVPISDYGIKSNQAMVYMLNTEQLFRDIAPIPTGSYMCLKDKNDTILAARGTHGEILEQIPEWMMGDPAQSGQELEVLNSTNSITGLEAVCYIPQEYFEERLRPVQRMTGFMAGSILLLVAILSFFMAAYHSNSESRTMRMIERIYPEIIKTPMSGRKKRKVFGDYVLGTIRMLDEKQRDYNERFNEMKSSLEEALLEKMVHGEVITEKDIENCKEVFGIDEGWFAAVYLRLINAGGGKFKNAEADEKSEEISLEEENMVRQIVLDVIRYQFDSSMGVPYYYYEEKENEGIFLLHFPTEMENEEEHIKKCVDQAVSYVEKHVDVQICMGIGGVTYGISKIIQSVKEARRQADQEKRRLFLGELEEKKTKKEILFSSKSMRKLSVLLSNGENQETQQFFLELHQTIDGVELSEDEAKQIFYGIRSVLDGMIKREGKEMEELPGFEEKKDILEQLDNLQTIALEICEWMKQKQERAMTQKKQNLISFIQENYSDSNLCAAMLADKFGVTEKYVFQIVRDCTGKSLGDLIKEIRFEKAEELLQKEVDINKIPEQIGFNSLNTFYKAFKRNYGISPGQWREMNRENPSGMASDMEVQK